MPKGRNWRVASFVGTQSNKGEEHENEQACCFGGSGFLVLACVYWFVPAGSLPHFMPGFVDGSSHVHVKHGLVALVLAVVLLGFAWVKREG